MSCGCQTPVHPAGDSACSGAESFALRVLGDDMQPEFNEGDIIVVEPGGALRDGCFVLAQHDGEWLFRLLARRENGWCLRALNPARTDLRDVPLADLSPVRGLVIQKAVPGRRKLGRSYL